MYVYIVSTIFYCIWICNGISFLLRACIAFVLVLRSLFGFHFWCSLFLREGRTNRERARGIFWITGSIVAQISETMWNHIDFHMISTILRLKIWFDVNLLAFSLRPHEPGTPRAGCDRRRFLNFSHVTWKLWICIHRTSCTSHARAARVNLIGLFLYI